MPYIVQEDRLPLNPHIESLVVAIRATAGLSPNTEGLVAYTITRLLNRVYPKDSYAQLALVMGMLDTVGMEFYRRRIAKYEDKKMEESGDVY